VSWTRYSPLLLALVAAGPAMAGSLDADDARRLRDAGEILPLSEILQRARDAQPGRVIEVELEDTGEEVVYELEVLDAGGVVWELQLDARSGAVLKRVPED
jgi:uncharacterized membrane protein YkoI